MTPAATSATSTLRPAPTHFTGKERDTESGNDYFGARYYASSMGRFMSPDWSAKVEPVPYSKLEDPQSLNLYAYVGNNPLIRADADGHAAGPMGCGGGPKCTPFKPAGLSRNEISGHAGGSQTLVGGKGSIGPVKVSGGAGYASGSGSYAVSGAGAAGSVSGSASVYHGEATAGSEKGLSSTTTGDALTAKGEANGTIGATSKGAGVAAGVEGHLDLASGSEALHYGWVTLTVSGEIGGGAAVDGSITTSGVDGKFGLSPGVGGSVELSVNWGGSGVTSSVSHGDSGTTVNPIKPPPE
ncbi:MAG: RHS repeat-associated core domain-containing protein [Terracidiphilus sp.]|jgi:RHS repeat-associated protein